MLANTRSQGRGAGGTSFADPLISRERVNVRSVVWGTRGSCPGADAHAWGRCEGALSTCYSACGRGTRPGPRQHRGRFGCIRAPSSRLTISIPSCARPRPVTALL